MTKFRFIFISFVMMFCALACSKTYTFQMFSYPPNSKPHESNWEYLGQVTVWHKGTTTKREEKVLNIIIKDKNDKIILNDTHTIYGGLFRHEVSWNTFEKITITTTEKTAEDSAPPLVLSYGFNGTKFIKKQG